MKTIRSILLIGLLAGIFFSSNNPAQAQRWWDTNGNVAGAGGPTPDGIWSTSVANWTTSSTGTSATGNWVNGQQAFLSAGTDATGAYTLTIDTGGVTAFIIRVEEGTPTITGDTLTLAGDANTGVWVDAGSTVTIDSDIAGVNGLFVRSSTAGTNAGTATLTGANTYTGRTQVNAGTLNLNGTHSAANDFIVNGVATQGGPGIVNVNGTETMTGGLFQMSNIAGTSTVNVNNGGTFELGGTGSALIGQNASGAVANINIFAGGLMDVTKADVRIANAGNGVAVQGTLTMSGGLMTLNASASPLRVANGSLTTGTLNLDGGILQSARTIRGDSPTGASAGTSTVNFNGGTLRAATTSTTFLQGMTAANVRNGGAIIDTQANNITIAQTLEHSVIDAAIDGGLTKNGGGTLTLSAANHTYTGITKVNTGVLALSNGTTTNSIADSTTIEVVSGATLNVTGLSGGGITLANGQTLKGGGTVVGNVAMSGGSLLAPGSSVGTLFIDGDLDISPAVAPTNSMSLLFELGTVSDLVDMTVGSGVFSIGSGVLEFDDFVFSDLGGLTAGDITLFDTNNTISGTLGSNVSGTVGSFNATLALANSDMDLVLILAQAAVIPEPATWLLAAMGLLGLGLVGRRSRGR